MSANAPPESPVAEADRRVERAKASLLARIDLLKHKIGDAKHQLDFKAQIAKHPLPAIGVAFALGALAAMTRQPAAPRDASFPEARSLTSAALGALAALGLRMARELAIGQLGSVAKQWWDQGGSGGHPAPTARAAASAHAADLEPFLEH
jgi:hypothetical protein